MKNEKIELIHKYILTDVVNIKIAELYSTNI